MGFIHSIKDIIDASKLKYTATHKEENDFKYMRTGLIQERTAIQQLHRELQDNLKEMQESNPVIDARLIQIPPEYSKYMDLAGKGVRLKISETPSPGVYRIEREEEVLI